MICDFRKQDVALGGQGAPLVPIGDKLLFRNFDSCLNLGGFANLSQNINNKITAYDVCAVNTVLNHLSNKKKPLLVAFFLSKLNQKNHLIPLTSIKLI